MSVRVNMVVCAFVQTPVIVLVLDGKEKFVKEVSETLKLCESEYSSCLSEKKQVNH